MTIAESGSLIAPSLTTIEIGGREILVMAILVLYLGSLVTRRWGFLRRNNVPPSVAGGLIFSGIVALLAGFEIARIDFNLELRNLLLLVFFSTIGLNAKLRSMVKGGKALFMLILACSVFLVMQNIVGITAAAALGKQSLFGLFGGSISLAGGHGTVIAWGESPVAHDVAGLAEFGIAVATIGLILGGLLGGVVAGRLIRSHGLKSPNRPETLADPNPTDQEAPPAVFNVTIQDFIGTLLALGLCLGAGDAVNRYLFAYEIRLPGFLTAMFIGVVITNLSDPLKIELKHNTIEIIGSISLQLFLAMSLMSMDLLSLADSAILLIAIAAIQAIMAVGFSFYVVFRIMGSDYDAAVITGGFFGMMLGATPVALASMDAVSSKHGPSAKALLVVPLVGAFFIDLINAGILTGFLRLPFLQP